MGDAPVASTRESTQGEESPKPGRGVSRQGRGATRAPRLVAMPPPPPAATNPCTKVSFVSEELAMLRLFEIALKEPRRGPGPPPHETYYCVECRAWHLTRGKR